MSGAVIREISGTTLTFKFGTMRAAEQALGGRSVFAVLNDGLGLDAISAIFHAAAQPQHKLSRDEADEVIDAIGVKTVITLLGEALAAYFGADVQAADTAAEGNGVKPGKASRRS